MATQQRKEQHAMSISSQDLDFIKSQFIIWNNESNQNSHRFYDKELHERGIRVQEELNTQRQLMEQGFAHMEKRFEQVEKRFEQVDKRFEQTNQEMDRRFDEVDRRFQVVDKRFDKIDDRFDKIFQNFRWTIGFLITIWGTILGAIQYLA